MWRGGGLLFVRAARRGTRDTLDKYDPSNMQCIHAWCDGADNMLSRTLLIHPGDRHA